MWEKIWANKYVRWVSVLPGALIGSLVAQALSKLVNYWQMGDGTLTRFFIEVSSGALFGGAFVALGVLIAPSHKKETAIGMMAIVAAFFGIAIFASVMQGGHFWSYVYAISMVVAAGIATFKMIEQVQNETR